MLHKTLSVVSFLIVAFIAAGQENGFPYGTVTREELAMQRYALDTTAVAVVLNEFGEAYFDNDNNHNLLFRYHARIKILKKEGLHLANIEIPLWKRKKHGNEVLRSFKASSFTLIQDKIAEAHLNMWDKGVFEENVNENLTLRKAAIPQVREGSIIEMDYVIESPFVYNFRGWEFQSSIPKVMSEYWAKIPGNYIYNMTLKGFLKLSKNLNSIEKDCFAPGGSNRADCALYKFAMKDIPAFVEEDYMTAKSNFLSAINFELSELRYFDGRVDKITKEWKDADQELRLHQSFGVQLKRGKDIEEAILPLVAGVSDPLEKARKIHAFIAQWFRWNEEFGKYCDLGIRKAFDSKVGNVGDINLSLIAALRFADLDVDPVILSTRENGVPIDIHPVLSDFNYVVAKLNVGDRFYLLDATDDFVPFGVLPERCLNGKGRVLAGKESYWIELKPSDRARQVTVETLRMSEDGVLSGTIQMSFNGYEAIRRRKKISTYQSLDDYRKSLMEKFAGFQVTDVSVENFDQIDKTLVEKISIVVGPADEHSPYVLFNPFITGRWEQNPFRSSERLYPVDFATTLERIFVLDLTLPDGVVIEELPEKIGLALPNDGGKYMQECQLTSNRLWLNNSLTISRTLFSAEEYHYLKELFSRVVQSQNADLLIKRKP